MASLFEQVTAFFDRKKLASHAESALGLVRLPYHGRSGQWNVVVKVEAEPPQLIVYALLPLPAPEGLRSRVSEAVQRANWGLPHGNFELDLDDGELRFKTSAFLTGGAAVAEPLEGLLFTNTATVDRYLPAFSAVIVQGADPRAAIERVDQTTVG
jgi:hypothetical protein